jgi:hypothetical protein
MSRGAVEEHYASTAITARVVTALRAVNGAEVWTAHAEQTIPLAPIEHRSARAVSSSHLGRVGLDLMAARLAHD